MKKFILIVVVFLGSLGAIEIDVKYLQGRVASDPSDIKDRYLLAKYFIKEHNYAYAKKYLSEILKVKPHENLAAMLYKKVNFLENLSKKSALNKADVNNQLLKIYNTSGDTEFLVSYVGCLQNGVDLYTDTHILAAKIFYKRGEYKKSKLILSKLRNQNNPKIKELKSKIKLKEYENSINKNPQSVDNLVYTLNQTGSKNQTILKLKSLLNKYPNNNKLRVSLAQNLYWDGRLNEAKNIIEPIKNLNQTTRTLYTNITSVEQNKQKSMLLQKAQILVSQKRYKEAIATYKEYYSVYHDSSVLKNIGEIYYFYDDKKLAVPYIKDYLTRFPNDDTARYQLATIYEKNRDYQNAIVEFSKVANHPNPLYYDAKYHYAYNLMKTKTDENWEKAKTTLTTLTRELSYKKDAKSRALQNYVDSLLVAVSKPRLKPTRYKDIYLSEGSHKIPSFSDVFSVNHIVYANKPHSLKKRKHSSKKNLYLGINSISDSDIRYQNYKVGVDNLALSSGVRSSIEVNNYHFKDLADKLNGNGVTLEAYSKSFSVGVEFAKVGSLSILSPYASVKGLVGIHSLKAELAYTNGIFLNYRSCMVKNKINVTHFGLSDDVLLDNLQSAHFGVDLNHYDDNNDNIFAQMYLPFFYKKSSKIAHILALGESYEHNSNLESCSNPVESYDVTSLEYKPSITFSQGNLQLGLKPGYSFKTKEKIFSYSLQGNYNFTKEFMMNLNCEQTRSRYSSQKATSCGINFMQEFD